jgi:ComEC/Rec2-related protein
MVRPADASSSAPHRRDPTPARALARALIMARARVWLSVAGVALGLLTAREGGGNFSWTLWLVSGLMALIAAGLLTRVTRRIARPASWACAWLALVSLSAALATQRFWTVPSDNLVRQVGELAPGQTRVLSVQGVVRSPPVASRPADPQSLARFLPREPSWWCELDLRRVQVDAPSASGAAGPVWREASGRLTLLVTGPMPSEPEGGGKGRVSGEVRIRPGAALRVLGTFEPPRARQNPGEPDPQLAARARGEVGLLRVSHAALLEEAPTITPTLWDRLRGGARTSLDALRQRAQKVLARAAAQAGPEGGVLLHALILGAAPEGAPARALQATQSQFARLGLAHALSISGFHLSVMAMVALWAVRLMGDRGLLEPLCVAALVLLYVALVPASPPLTRSAIMVLALLLARGLGRRTDPLCVLGLVAIALLAAQPLDLWSLGFQLSLGLTALLFWSVPHAGAVLFATPVRGLIERRPRLPRALLEGAQRGVTTALVCWACALPAVLHQTGMLSPWGILASVLVAPLIVVVLWIGYIALLLGVLVPACAGAMAFLLGAVTRGLLTTTGALDALPASALRVPPVSLLWTLVATLVVVLASRCVTRANAWRWVLACGLLVAWLAIGWTRAVPLPTGTAFRVEMLSVGDGSCFLLRDRTGRTLLWDA